MLARIEAKIALAKAFSSRTSGSATFIPAVRSLSSSDSAAAAAPFDLAVIGGGSGGLACAKEAAELGARVCVFDFVPPSPTRGTSWGLGGTCVNVGCIPKKLMHLAAGVGDTLRHAGAYGWQLDGGAPRHDWEALSGAVKQHVKSLNFGHRSQLMQRNIDYCNMLAKFEGYEGGTPDRPLLALSATNPKTGRSRRVLAANAVVAVGGRPSLPADVPGAAQLGITSDDLFWLPRSPGRTLVVGGGYVALECAGFLAGLGLQAEVMVRTDVCLRGFDRQMANLVVDFMRQHCGVKFHLGCKPMAVTDQSGSASGLRVDWRNADGETNSAAFDSVLFATGRRAVTADLNLDAIGVAVDSAGRVVGGEDGQLEKTSVPGVFAIGDALQNGVELTPVAIRAGKLLARQLFDKTVSAESATATTMDYSNVATTVFTPLEYACVGLSEEAALTKLGPNAVEVYHAVYTPYEFVLPHLDQTQCYIKAICGPSSSGRQPLLGLHVTGPNAGEIVQGFAALLRTGTAAYEDLAGTVGIHPTSAEEITKLWITKKSGLSPMITGC
uniref:Thioredoxin reductase n=3 Tax=Macrostomum lignano TaxID=282301 RepID=A0A1I8FWZ1_9PLAT